MNGKGSKRRPMQVSQKEFEQNWDRVFGKNKEIQKLRDQGYIVHPDVFRITIPKSRHSTVCNIPCPPEQRSRLKLLAEQRAHPERFKDQ